GPSRCMGGVSRFAAVGCGVSVDRDQRCSLHALGFPPWQPTGLSEVQLHAELEESSDERIGGAQPSAASRSGVPSGHGQDWPRIERVVDVENALHFSYAAQLEHLDEADVGLVRAILE